MAGRRQHGEGSLYHRKDRGQWVAVADLGWRDGRRDRREFTGPTPAAALGRRETFLARRRDGFTMPRGREPYVGEWVLHWLYNIARPKVAATTWERSYRQKAEDLVVPYFSATRLSEIDEDLIEEWHAHLQRQISPRTRRPRSASTITQAHVILSMALKVAVIRKRIGRNPASNVTPPRDEEDAKPEPLTEDEMPAVLAACKDRRSGPRWVTALATGIRQGEGLGLLWPYVSADDPDDASVQVEWELVRLKWKHGCDDAHGCGAAFHRYPCPDPCPKIRSSGRPHACIGHGDPRCCPAECESHARNCPQRHSGGLRLKRPKSAKSRRVIPLAPYAAKTLRQWKKDQSAERLAHPAWRGWAHDPESCPRKLRTGQHVCPDCMLPARPGLLVFAQPDGTPVDPRADWEDFAALQEDAGVEYHNPHSGRHGFATILLEGGEDVRVVQELMGHATPDFTQKAYQHVRRKLRKQAAATINRALGGE